MQEQLEGAGTAESAATNFYAFDALFRRALGGHQELAKALKRCGFDPDQPQDCYPTEIWTRCLEVSRAMLFADRPPDDGMRELGRLFADGVEQTALGQAYAGIRMRPEAYLARFPSVLYRARADQDLTIVATEARRWRLEFRGPDVHPFFLAGLLEVRLRERATPARVEVLFVEPRRFQLEVSW